MGIYGLTASSVIVSFEIVYRGDVNHVLILALFSQFVCFNYCTFIQIKRQYRESMDGQSNVGRSEESRPPRLLAVVPCY